MQNARGTLQRLRHGVVAFFGWWRDELLGLVPEHARARFAGAEASIVVAASPAGFHVFEARGTGTWPAAVEAAPLLSKTEAAKAAVALAKATPTARAGVRLSRSQCFMRSVELPRAARDDAGRILDLDIERSTPFKLKDVYTAHTIEDRGAPEGRVRAHQLVVKRDLIDPILDALRDFGLTVMFVDCWDEDGRSPLPVNFLAARDPARTDTGRPVTTARVLATFAALLIVTAVVLALYRHETALDGVQARITETRVQATAVRRALDGSDAAVARLADLQRMKLAQVSAIEILEELSKLLPDSVWISDLRLEGESLDISGLAQSATALPSLFGRSTLFVDATMTAPVTLDPQEDKERYSLRARVRQPRLEGSIGREEKRQ